MSDEHLSVTGQATALLRVTKKDLSHAPFWTFLYPLLALPGALRDHDWLRGSFWAVSFVCWVAMGRFGQRPEARRKQFPLFVLMMAAGVIVVLPLNVPHLWRVIGLIVFTVTVLIDVALGCATRRQSSPRVPGWS